MNLRRSSAWDQELGTVKVHASGRESEVGEELEIANGESGDGLALVGVVTGTSGTNLLWSLAAISIPADDTTGENTLLRHNTNHRRPEGPKDSRIIAHKSGSYIAGIVMQGSSLQIQMLAPDLTQGRVLSVPEPRSRTVRPSLCGFPDGRFSVAYDQDEEQGLLLQSFDAEGAPVAPYVVAADRGLYGGHRLSCSGDGRLLLAYLKEGKLHFRQFASQTDSVGAMYYFPRAGLKAFDAAWAPDGSVALATIAEGVDTVAVEKVHLDSLPRTPIGIRSVTRDRYLFLPRWEGKALRLVLPTAASVRIEILDTQGRVLALAYEGPGDGKTVSLPIWEWEPGLRILRLRADGRVFTAKATQW
jgi:hypothetical protein